MTKLERAKMLDEILDLFKEDRIRNFTELEEQFKGQIGRFPEIKTGINFLIGEGVINNHSGKLTLTSKGDAIHSDIESLGYLTKQKEADAAKKLESDRFCINLWLQIGISILTIVGIIVGIRSC